MQSATHLGDVLGQLTQQARALGLTDAAWAARAGLRKETLSRLRRRHTCDFTTLAALAGSVGARLGVSSAHICESARDDHFPPAVDRDYEEQLVALCASGSLEPERWAACGPRFFMAGLAVMLASTRGADRRGLLALAEQLHPGATEPQVFERWLASSALRPSRFLPLVDVHNRRAA